MQDAVDAVADDVAVAGDVRRDDRRPGRERLGQHHAEALAAQRRRAEDVGARERGVLALVVAAAEDGHALVAVEQQRRDLLLRRRRRPRAWPGRARAAPRRRAAARAGPCARPPGRRTRSAAGRRAGAAAPPRRTARGLEVRRRWGSRGRCRRRSAGPSRPRPRRRAMRTLRRFMPRLAPMSVRHPVGDRVLGVAVEGADEWRRRVVHGVPEQDRRDRLVHVDDVVAAVLSSPRARRKGLAVSDDVGDRPVDPQAHGAAERDQVVGRPGARAAPRVHAHGQPVVGVERGEHSTSWPVAMNCSARASMCRVTPPGYVQEYGDTSAIRIRAMLEIRAPCGERRLHRAGDLRRSSRVRPSLPHVEDCRQGSAACLRISSQMRPTHFVKYTFLSVDPAWRRLDEDQRAEDKREFLAACEDFADGHLLRAFSLVGTRGDADLMLLTPGAEPRPHPRVPCRARPRAG